MHLPLAFLVLLNGSAASPQSQNGEEVSATIVLDARAKSSFTAKFFASPTSEYFGPRLVGTGTIPITHSLKRNERIDFSAAVTGCTANKKGNCLVTAILQIAQPTGKAWMPPAQFLIYEGSAAELAGNWLVWTNLAQATLDTGEPLGNYTATLAVTDEVSNTTRQIAYTINAAES